MPKIMKAKCEYRLPDLDDKESYQCPHPPYPEYKERLCLFHQPKPSSTEKLKLPSPDLNRLNAIESEFKAALYEFITNAEHDFDVEEKNLIDVRGFYFPPTHFQKDFVRKPDFSYATFIEYGDLETPKWKRQSGITFEQGALFYNTQFIGPANFSHSVFKGNVDFNSASFLSNSDFSYTTFNNDAVFSNCDFKLDATFWNCRFRGSAEFNDAVFGGFLNCCHCVFQDANFFGIQAKVARFGDSVFSGPAQVHVATFDSFLEFDRTRLEDLFNLDGCTLPLKTRFEKTDFRGECFFTALEIPAEANFTFATVNLSKAQFWDTNLESIRFRDIQWALFKRRSALWDEFRQLEEGEERSYEKIAENYRQLVLNYELKRDYESAEDFHVGEMEMRRRKRGVGVKTRALQTVREWANLFGLYRISSNYGSSYNQAFVVLLVFFALISALFLFAGFQPNPENRADPPGLIEYNLLTDTAHHWAGLKRLAAEYLKACMYTFSIITFQKDRFYEPVGWQGQLCLYIAVLVLTAQAALVLLAIRRQFRR